MDASFAFWWPSSWTMIGALFTVLSFAALIHTSNVRAPFVSPELRSISADVENLRRVRADVESLMMALTPHREQPAETTRALEEMRTDLRTLVCTACEALDSAERSRKDSQEATSAALEILAEARKITRGDPKVQGKLPAFSLRVYLKAQAEALARERTQANPNPFCALD
jgi:hypothetical protein